MRAIVIPVYKNQESIPALLESLVGLRDRLGGDLRVTFVVDGSPDSCFERLREALPATNLQATLILLSRNFGSFIAIRTGLAHTEADHYAIIAADLQEPPELCLEFFEELERGRSEIVLGTRDGREDPWTSKILSSLFWGFYRRLVIKDMPKGGVDVFGCARTVRDRLLEFSESHSSLIGELFWVGFRRSQVKYRRRRREHGRSSWTLKKKTDYLLDSVFAFTDLPIRLLIGVGGLGSLLSLIVAAVAVVSRLSGYTKVSGYTALLIAIIFFGAVNILGLGIVGSYAHRTYENSKGRPLSIVAAKLDIQGKE